MCLTGEKMTAGRDGLLSGEGRAGVTAADQLYATAATEEMPLGRLTLGGVAVCSRPSVLLLRTRFAAARGASRVAAGIFSKSSSSMFCSRCPQG
jgi:hypothetical protein